MEKAINKEEKQFVTVGEGDGQHVIPLNFIVDKQNEKFSKLEKLEKEWKELKNIEHKNPEQVARSIEVLKVFKREHEKELKKATSEGKVKGEKQILDGIDKSLNLLNGWYDFAKNPKNEKFLSNEWKEWKNKNMEKAINQILLDEQVGGKGRHFSTRFLQAGLVKYSFGVCLLEKETIDKFIYNFVGCPVIINHKDVTNESAKDDRVGVISRVWFNDKDGWYWGEGVIFEQEALDLIDKGYNVSCQYEISEYSTNGGIHNGNDYDKVILNGKPEHLAIVKNPRYENAMIAVNAMEIDEMDLEAINGGEGSGDFDHAGRPGKVGGSEPAGTGRKGKYDNKDGKTTITKQADKNGLYSDENFKENAQRLLDRYIYNNEWGATEFKNKVKEFVKKYNKTEEDFIKATKQAEKKEDKQEGGKELYEKMLTPTVMKTLRDSVKAQQYENPDAKVGDTVLDSDRIISLYTSKLSTEEYNKFDFDKAEDYLFEELHKIEKEVFTKQPKKQEATQLKLKLQNDIMQAINELKETDMFKNLFRKRSKTMDREEMKDLFMECLTDLTASNEKEVIEDEEVKEEEVAENKCKNKEEELDYKKLYNELKAKVDAKEKEDAETAKAKNSIEEQKEMLLSGKVETKVDFITQSRARELGKELF